MSPSVSALQLANSAAPAVLGRVGGTQFGDTSRLLRRESKRNAPYRLPPE